MNWWDKKLGTPASRPAVHQQTSYQGYDPRLLPGRQPPVPQYQPPPEGEVVTDPNHEFHIGDVLGQWRGNVEGGLGETQTTGDCPGCGSTRFFSRRVGGVTTKNGVIYPRPECMDCGYPNEQGTLYGAPDSGMVLPSRQAAKATEGSWASLTR